jgi:hypothetical protein
MKKLIILGFTAFLIQSCTVTKYSNIDEEVYNCSNDITYWKNYEDTIRIEFVGVDSSIFKGKNYKMIADSLNWIENDKYSHYDVQNIETGEIHRVIWSKAKYDTISPFDTTKYELLLFR